MKSAESHKPWRDRMVAFALGLALVAAAEGVLRVTGFEYPPVAVEIVMWSPETDARMESGDDLHLFDDATLWSPRPGALVQPPGGERISSMGFRGRDPDPRSELRVLVLGDSLTFGMGVAGLETYAAVLERRLSALAEAPQSGGTSVQVLNGGIIGSTLLQGIERYRDVRGSWTPQLVIAAFGAVNEQWPAVDASDAEKIAYLSAQRRVSIARSIREHSRIAHWVASWGADADGRSGGDVESERPTLDELFADPDYRRRVTPDEFGAALAILESEVRGDGGQLVLLRMPRRVAIEESMFQVLDYDPVLESFADSSACPLANGHAAFRASDIAEDDLFWDSFHPTRAGHEQLAGELFEIVVPLVEALWREI